MTKIRVLVTIIAAISFNTYMVAIPFPVYFADIIKEDNAEILHFEWRADFSSYDKALITDSEGNLLGELQYPMNCFDIKNFKQHEVLYINAIDKLGASSVPVKVDVNKDYSSLLATATQDKIIVRKMLDKQAMFIESQTSKEFIAKGVNYCGIRMGDHDTFEPDIIANQAHVDIINTLNNTADFILRPLSVGEQIQFYDKYSVETFMRIIKAHGYNLVRVFIKTGRRGSVTTNIRGMSGPAETTGIYAPYMDNFVDFVSRAQKYGIYVMPCFTENEMLDNNYFKILSEGASGQSIFFSNAGIAAKQRYLELFLTYIKNKNPLLLNSIFALTMQNEFAFHSDEVPFNQTSGTYTFLDGSTYDMANDDRRRTLANVAIRNYYSKMRQTVQTHASGMLIGEGTFALGAVGKTYENSKGIRPISGNNDLRFPMTAVELLNTDIDFLDLHIYRWGVAGTGGDVFNYFANNMKILTPEGINLMKSKPVLIGEFGSFKFDEPNIDQATTFVKQLQQAALDYGIKGSVFWTLNTFEQKRLWNLMWENNKIMTGFKNTIEFSPVSQDVVLTFDITPTSNWSDFYIKPPIEHENYVAGHFQTRLLFGGGNISIFNGTYQGGLTANNFSFDTNGTKYNFRITLYSSISPAKITVEAKQDGATNWIVLFEKLEQAYGSLPVGTIENNPGYLQIENLKVEEVQSTKVSSMINNQIKLYPVPIHNILNISTPVIIHNVKIYSIAGVLLRNYYPTPNNKIVLDIKEFKSGIYYVQLTTKNGINLRQIVKK